LRLARRGPVAPLPAPVAAATRSAASASVSALGFLTEIGQARRTHAFEIAGLGCEGAIGARTFVFRQEHARSARPAPFPTAWRPRCGASPATRANCMVRVEAPDTHAAIAPPPATRRARLPTDRCRDGFGTGRLRSWT
jgi:hypothetical protein